MTTVIPLKQHKRKEEKSMERIASFQIDHDKLMRGIYLSRQDGDVLTFDLRLTLPNREPVLSTGTLHAIEHIGAT